MAKERATTMYTWVPSKYTIEPVTVSILGKYMSISGFCNAIRYTCTCLDHSCNKYCDLIGQEEVTISHKNL